MADSDIREDKVMYKEDFNSALVECDLCGYLEEPQYSVQCIEEKEAAATEAETQPNEPHCLGDSWWCLCRNCMLMVTEMELLCCNEVHRGQFLPEEVAESEGSACELVHCSFGLHMNS